MSNYKPISIMASAVIEASDNEGEDVVPKISIVANSGNPMHVAGFRLPVVVNIKGMTYRSAITPIIMDHDVSQRVGHTTSITKTKGVLNVKGLASSTSQHAVDFVADSKRGFPWQASIGADIIVATELADGKRKTVNGKVVIGPMIIAEETLLKEVSIVTLGADSETSAIAASKRKTKQMTKKSASNDELTKLELSEIDGFKDYVETDLSLSWEDINDETAVSLYASFEFHQEVQEKAKLPKKVKAKTKIKAAIDDDDANDDDISRSRALRAAEHRRVDGIEATVVDLAKEGIKVEAGVVSKAIEDGVTIEAFELSARRKARDAKVIHSSKPDLQTDSSVLECALARQIFSSPKWLEKAYDEKTLTASDRKDMKGIGLHYLMDMTIRAAGESFTGSRKSNDYIRAALHATRQIRGSGYSTISLPNLLENVGNKALIASYELQETVWRSICAIRSLSDFKVHSRYQLNAQGSYKKIGATGELKHVTLSDAKYTLQGDTYGAIIELTRQDIFNDDLNAFEQIPVKLGMMAAIRIEEAVMVLLLSNPGSFFSAGNKNLITGGSALSLTNLGISERKFMDQVDVNGKPILVRPEILLVGTQDSVNANNIFNQTQLMVGGGDTTVGPQFVSNPHVGKFRPYVSPYLNNTLITDQDGAAISGQSSTKSYLFADPQKRAALNVGFLNGNQIPTIESSDVDFDRLGMSWRSYHDWGVGVEDPKAAVLDAGA